MQSQKLVQAEIRQLSGSRQAVVGQSSGSRQAVVRQSSGSRQTFVRYNHHLVVGQSSDSLQLFRLPTKVVEKN